MQAMHEGRLVSIERPELLEHIFLLTADRSTQAALLRTSRAWAAVAKDCTPLHVAVGLATGTCWPPGKRWSADLQPHPALNGLQAAAAWLSQQRRLIDYVELQLDAAQSKWDQGRWRQSDDASELARLYVDTVRAQAAEVLQAVPGLANLSVRSVCDFQWLPQLTALTKLDLMSIWDEAEYAGNAGPLDCVARVAPQLRSLCVDPYFGEEDEEDPLFLSTGAALPPGLTRLEVSGLVEGLEPHFSQLKSLDWHPIDEEPDIYFPVEAIHGLSQATKLTNLELSAIVPSDIPAFFASLACLTGLLSLSLKAAPSVHTATWLNPQYYEDTAVYDLVMQTYLPEALAGMSRLTYLYLAGHDMPVCPATLAYLPALQWLELGLNDDLTELPHGPWPALERLQVDQELIDAALADLPMQRTGRLEGLLVGSAYLPTVQANGHALWSMRHLTQLEVYWMGKDGEPGDDPEKDRTIHRLLPQLRSIESI